MYGATELAGEGFKENPDRLARVKQLIARLLNKFTEKCDCIRFYVSPSGIVTVIPFESTEIDSVGTASMAEEDFELFKVILKQRHPRLRMVSEQQIIQEIIEKKFEITTVVYDEYGDGMMMIVFRTVNGAALGSYFLSLADFKDFRMRNGYLIFQEAPRASIPPRHAITQTNEKIQEVMQ